MTETGFLYKSPNHAANLNNMRLENKWCDVTIRVNKKEARAHKVILAANLKYFDTMLSSDSFKESKESIVTMGRIKEADLDAFLSYAYTGEILLTDSNALDWLELANYLGEDGIKEACIEFLEIHLRKEEACRAYIFSDRINCLSLKNVAKQIILFNFLDLSKTADYLALSYEHLIDIVSDVKSQPTELQKKYFEGMLRWIMHDVTERRIRVNDLLNSIEIEKLSSKELMHYLFDDVDANDEKIVIKDVFTRYFDHESQQINCKSLMAVSFRGKIVYFQFCNLAKKEWSLLKQVLHSYESDCLTNAVLNDEFYYTSGTVLQEIYLNVFDPKSRRSSLLLTSSSILSRSAMCACSRFFYLCGGLKKDGLISSQVLKYDPVKNSFEFLPPMETRRSKAAAIFYQGFLLVLGGSNGYKSMNLVEKYDPNTKRWTAFPSMREIRSCHALTVLRDKLYVCGGNTGRMSVEVFDPANNSWQFVATMSKKRQDVLLVAYESKLLAIGGDENEEKTVEVYDPDKNEWQIDQDLSSGLQIKCPRGNLISFKCIADADRCFRSSET